MGDLSNRLRNYYRHEGRGWPVMDEAATRIEKLEDALQRIVDFHIGDCPALVEEIDFAKRINREIRKIAFDALIERGEAA